MVNRLEMRDGKEMVVHYGSDLEAFAWHTPLTETLHCSLCASGADVLYTNPAGVETVIKRLADGSWEGSWYER